MNFKRKKSKRNVRCTLCTADRWKGNAKDRRKAREKALRERNRRAAAGLTEDKLAAIMESELYRKEREKFDKEIQEDSDM